jgi:hypothetical protein
VKLGHHPIAGTFDCGVRFADVSEDASALCSSDDPARQVAGEPQPHGYEPRTALWGNVGSVSFGMRTGIYLAPEDGVNFRGMVGTRVWGMEYKLRDREETVEYKYRSLVSEA